MSQDERGSARTDYTIALSLAGVLVAIAMPRLLRPRPVGAGLVQIVWPWLALGGAAAILAMAGRIWWQERRRR